MDGGADAGCGNDRQTAECGWGIGTVKRNRILTFLFLAGVAVACGIGIKSRIPAERRLNVVLITLDTTRADHLGGNQPLTMTCAQARGIVGVDRIVQELPNDTVQGGVWGSETYWGNYLYTAGVADHLRAWRLTGGTVAVPSVGQAPAGTREWVVDLCVVGRHGELGWIDGSSLNLGHRRGGHHGHVVSGLRDVHGADLLQRKPVQPVALRFDQSVDRFHSRSQAPRLNEGRHFR